MGISAWGRARDDHGNRRHPHPGAARAHRRTARSRSGARRRGARRRDPRDGRARRGLPAPVPGAHARGHRPGRRGARDRARTARAVRRAHPPRPCRVRRARACAARPGHRGGRGHPLRSRGLVAATRPRRARVLLLAGCPARHAHGCHEHAHRGRSSSRRTPRRNCGGSSTSTATRSSPRATRAGSCSSGRSDRWRPRLSSSSSSSPRPPPPPSAPAIPAKRVFQALRIEVNQELAALERALPAAIDALEVGGRIVVLAYQSLEDRIVKRALQARSTSTAPAGLPVELPQHRPELRLLVRGAELAGRGRARSQSAGRARASARGGTDARGMSNLAYAPAVTRPATRAVATAARPAAGRHDARPASGAAQGRLRGRHRRQSRADLRGATAAEHRGLRRGVPDPVAADPAEGAAAHRAGAAGEPGRARLAAEPRRPGGAHRDGAEPRPSVLARPEHWRDLRGARAARCPAGARATSCRTRR